MPATKFTRKIDKDGTVRLYLYDFRCREMLVDEALLMVAEQFKVDSAHLSSVNNYYTNRNNDSCEMFSFKVDVPAPEEETKEEIKEGDWVRETVSPYDVGVVVDTKHRSDPNRVWVRWETGDQAGRVLDINKDLITLIAPTAPKKEESVVESDIEAAIQLLKSNGYLIYKRV